MTMVGTAVVLAVGGSNITALAGIDAGGAPVTSRGSVTQCSSIYVNGVRYDTDQAVFVIDGELGQESNLHAGQVVTVFGSVDPDGTNGTAHLVVFENTVKGLNQNRVWEAIKFSTNGMGTGFRWKLDLDRPQ